MLGMVCPSDLAEFREGTFLLRLAVGIRRS